MMYFQVIVWLYVEQRDDVSDASDQFVGQCWLINRAINQYY